MIERYVAEAIGTFALVFIGTAAIEVNRATGGDVTHVGVALAFGLVVLTMVYAVGDISGAHLNPAVTVGFWAAGRLSLRTVPPYILSQCAGAFAASITVRFLLPANHLLGATMPGGSLSQSFVLETLLTALLMFVVLGVSTGAKEKGITAGVAVGSTVALGALVGGPISGASMNPARSLAPALVSGNLAHLWIYLTAPLLGAILAVGGCRSIRRRDCCGRVTTGTRASSVSCS